MTLSHCWQGGLKIGRSLLVSLLAPRSSVVYTIIVLATACVWFFSVFDVAFVTRAEWLLYSDGDATQAIVAFQHFIKDDWRFPVFQVDTLGFPSGANVIFTDSIPILALVFKPIAPFLPRDFNPFGLWILISALALAHALALLVAHFGHRGALAGICATLLAVNATPFAARILMQHPALCAQALPVYGLVLYFKMVDQRRRSCYLAFLVLLLIALLTHAYLFVMVSLIFATALLGRLLCGRDVREPAIYGGLIAAIVVAAGWASGYIGYADLPGTVDSNFGHYSMNLLAPISPVQDGQILPRQADATGGQYEGINYLGAGIIVLLLIAVPGQIRRLPALAWTRVGPLVGGLSLLTALAVSNRIYLGERLLWTYEIPSSLSFITVFRSSGRFFWPVCYAAIAFAVVSTLDSRRRRSLTAALMVVGLALQLYDTTTNRAYLRDGAGTEHGASAAEGGLRAVASRHRRLAMVPPVQCMERRSTEFWAASRVAAGLGISIHSFVAARYAPSVPEDCRQLMNSVRERGFDQGTLYILNKSTARSVSVRPELAEHCGTLEMFILCTLDREAVSGMAALEPSVSHWPLIDGMAGPTELRNVLGWGWSNENAVGVWAVGRSEILFRSDGACADVEALVLRIGAFVPEGPSRVEISINDMPVLVETYPEGDPRTVTVPLDACDAATGLVRATFDAERVISPIEAGVSGDPRPLGVYLLGAELIDSRRTAVSERIEVQPANLQVGDSYVLRIPAVQDTRVEIRYRLNDGQEETFEATLDDDGGVEFLVSNSTRRGIYEFLAYRVGTGPWRTVAATATVR